MFTSSRIVVLDLKPHAFFVSDLNLPKLRSHSDGLVESLVLRPILRGKFPII